MPWTGRNGESEGLQEDQFRALQHPVVRRTALRFVLVQGGSAEYIGAENK